MAEQAPAVSGPNAKVEFDAGALSLPTSMFMLRAAGTVTLPLGERFGLQADMSASTAPGFITSGALHVFTRDPASYLIGGTFGFVRSPAATVLAAGPEAELYFDRWTLEAWSGLALAHPTAPASPNRVAPFLMANAGYYLTDNSRISVGFSWLDGYKSLHATLESLLVDVSWPVAVTGELRLGQDGAWRGTVGLRGYFGPDPSKTLVLRHREDDPADWGPALYAAAGGQTLVGLSIVGGGAGADSPQGGGSTGGNSPDQEPDPFCVPGPPPPGYRCE